MGGPHDQSVHRPYAALLLRGSPGILFLAHAGLKFFVFGIPCFVGFFASLGLPAILSYAVIVPERLGGWARILGTYPPLATLPLAAEIRPSIA